MSKLAMLPNVERTPSMILDMVRDQLPDIKTLFVVVENNKGKWIPFFNSCNVADIYFAGAVLQHNAVKVSGAVE